MAGFLPELTQFMVLFDTVMGCRRTFMKSDWVAANILLVCGDNPGYLKPYLPISIVLVRLSFFSRAQKGSDNIEMRAIDRQVIVRKDT